MELSVIICTYNRVDSLITVLKSFENQKIKSDMNWEIIIIDNNSKDETHNKVIEFKNKTDMEIRYFLEINQGLSYARNRGVVESRGEYLFFIDDDEMAHEGLVEAVYRTFKDHGCDSVGGRIHLLPQGRLPDWLEQELWGFLGHLDYGDEVIQLDEDRYPFGGNMAFSRKSFEKTGLFHVDMGRKGQHLFGGEEYDFFKRFLASGGIGIYQPNAIAYHIVEKQRMKKSYFRKLHYSSGLQQAHLDEDHLSGFRCLHGIPLFLFRQLTGSAIRLGRDIVVHGWDRSFRKEMTLWHFLGLMTGYYQRQSS